MLNKIGLRFFMTYPLCAFIYLFYYLFMVFITHYELYDELFMAVILREVFFLILRDFCYYVGYHLIKYCVL